MYNVIVVYGQIFYPLSNGDIGFLISIKFHTGKWIKRFLEAGLTFHPH
jgi:hypothetical protein